MATDDHEERERRVTDSSKLQELVAALGRVPPKSRMYFIHDELMHAIERSLAKHQGHRFEEKEINVIKDVSFDIVYILDPKNRPATGFIGPAWDEFKGLSALKKIGAAVAVFAFIGAVITGIVDFAKNVLELTRMIAAETSIEHTASPPPANNQNVSPERPANPPPASLKSKE
jgi:hypothetical protein